MTSTFTTSDGVDVVVHDLAGDRNDPPLLISHATGFCAHAYEPLAAALGAQYWCRALDHRGHGATQASLGWDGGDAVAWAGFGDDVLAVIRGSGDGRSFVGLGHSMGGSALLLAAHQDPDRFERLILFEPIAMPRPDPLDAADDLPLVQSALRRRRRFDSFDAAFDNFHSKPPLSRMTEAALRGYVDHGLRGAPDGGVELCCDPQFEAAIFLNAQVNGVWELLPMLEVPVLVVSGALRPYQPSEMCPAIAQRLPRGELLQLPHLDHFGPFSHPEELAALV